MEAKVSLCFGPMKTACLGVADVEVAVRFGREAGSDLAPRQLQVACQQWGAVGDVDSAAVAEGDGGVHPVVLVGPAQVVPLVGCGRRLRGGGLCCPVWRGLHFHWLQAMFCFDRKGEHATPVFLVKQRGTCKSRGCLQQRSRSQI